MGKVETNGYLNIYDSGAEEVIHEVGKKNRSKIIFS